MASPLWSILVSGARVVLSSSLGWVELEGPAMVARELTKLFEEIRRGSLPDLADHYRREGPPKGEITIVIGPPLEKIVGEAEIDHLLGAALKDGSVRDAADAVTAATGLPRR